MQPIDYRNDTFTDIQARLSGLRLAVFAALSQHGPCTTRELATRASIDLLTVRPRVTELIDLGLVVLDDSAPAATKNEGVYRALTTAEAERLFNQRWTEANKEGQLTLRL